MFVKNKKIDGLSESDEECFVFKQRSFPKKSSSCSLSPIKIGNKVNIEDNKKCSTSSTNLFNEDINLENKNDLNSDHYQHRLSVQQVPIK